MEDDIKYIVVEDLQGGSFGTERVYTLDEWREQAYAWSDADDCFEDETEAKHYKETLAELTEEELIEYISDQWQLIMAKVFEFAGELYAYEGCEGDLHFYSVVDECAEEISKDNELYAILTDFVKSLDSNEDK